MNEDERAKRRRISAALLGCDDDVILVEPEVPRRLWDPLDALPRRKLPAYRWDAPLEALNTPGPGIECYDATIAEVAFQPAIPQRHAVWSLSRFDNIVSASRAPTVLHHVPYDDGWGARWGVPKEVAARHLLFQELVCERGRAPMFPADDITCTEQWLEHHITRGVLHEDVVAALTARAFNLALHELGSLRFPEPFELMCVSFDRLTHKGENVEIKCPVVITRGLGIYADQVRMQEAWLRLHMGRQPDRSYFVQLNSRIYFDKLWYPWRDPKLRVAENIARLSDLVSRMPPEAARAYLYVQRPEPEPRWLQDNFHELAHFDLSVRRCRAARGITLERYAQTNGYEIPPHTVVEEEIQYE